MNANEPEPRHLHVHLGDLGPGDVHMHLGDLGPGDVHVHIYAGTSDSRANSEVTREPATEPTVEASLKRLKDWDAAHADDIQAAYDGLKRLGLTPHPAGSRNPQPGAYIQPYLRWTHPSHPSGSVGYLNAATFSFAGTNDVPRVKVLPGAEDKGSEVRFSITSREGVSQALSAVKHIVEGSLSSYAKHRVGYGCRGARHSSAIRSQEAFARAFCGGVRYATRAHSFCTGTPRTRWPAAETGQIPGPYAHRLCGNISNMPLGCCCKVIT